MENIIGSYVLVKDHRAFFNLLGVERAQDVVYNGVIIEGEMFFWCGWHYEVIDYYCGNGESPMYYLRNDKGALRWFPVELLHLPTICSQPPKDRLKNFAIQQKENLEYKEELL